MLAPSSGRCVQISGAKTDEIKKTNAQTKSSADISLHIFGSHKLICNIIICKSGKQKTLNRNFGLDGEVSL